MREVLNELVNQRPTLPTAESEIFVTCIDSLPINDIEAPKALDVQLRGMHIEPHEANSALAAILNGGKKDYLQYQEIIIW